MNGLRVVVDDYVGTQVWRARILWLLITLTLVLFMIGTVMAITSESVAGSLGPNCIQ